MTRLIPSIALAFPPQKICTAAAIHASDLTQRYGADCALIKS